MKNSAEVPDIYVELISEATNNKIEATYRQHLGKVYLSAGDYSSAQKEFEKALAFRISTNSSEDLLASSRQACTYISKLTNL